MTLTTKNFSIWTDAPEDPRTRVLHAPRQEVDPLVEVDVVEEDAVAWLVILGAGTWGYANRAGLMRTFSAGLHRVGKETVDFALQEPQGKRVIVVAQEETPLLTRRQLHGPLLPDHLEGYRGVEFQPVTEAEKPEQDDTTASFTHHCTYCPKKFPSSQALARHVSRHH